MTATLERARLTERGARGVAQVPGQDARDTCHGVTESTGPEARRTENAGAIAPPARPGTPRADAPRSVSRDRTLFVPFLLPAGVVAAIVERLVSS